MPIPVIQPPGGGSSFLSGYKSGLLLPEEVLKQKLMNQIYGAQAKYAEPMTQNELLSKELANRISGVKAKYAEPSAQEELRKAQLENQYYAPNMQSEIGLRGAQTGHLGEETKKLAFERQNPLFMAEHTRDLAALMKAGLVSPEQVQQMVKGISEAPLANVESKMGNLTAKGWTSMTAPEKNYALAQARALGIPNTEATQLFVKGRTLQDLADMKGISGKNLEQLQAKFAPTQANVTKLGLANQTLAALNAVEPDITAAYKPYASRVSGKSPKLIKDMLTGENPDQQSDFFAAYALYPEISALRIKAQGGNVGHGAIQAAADAAQSRMNTLGLSPNSEVYEKSMQKMNQLINKMNQAENQQAFGFGTSGKQSMMNMNQDLSHLSDDELRRIAG